MLFPSDRPLLAFVGLCTTINIFLHYRMRQMEKTRHRQVQELTHTLEQRNLLLNRYERFVRNKGWAEEFFITHGSLVGDHPCNMQ